MHMLGEPTTMQDDPRYDDVVAEGVRLPARTRGGGRVRREPVLTGSPLTPVIGSARTSTTTSPCSVTSNGSPIWMRPSCSASIPQAVHRHPDRGRGPTRPRERTWRPPSGPPSAARTVVRVHDVRATVRALRVVDATERAGLAVEHVATSPRNSRNRDEGDGEVVLLLHGWPVDVTVWRRLAPAARLSVPRDRRRPRARW